MPELPDNQSPSPQEPLESGMSNSFDSTSATPASYVAYLKFVDSAKKATAVGMVVCGLAFIPCINSNHQQSRIGVWAGSVFGCGVLACLVATFVLVVEHLVRPAPTRFTLRSAFLRLLFTLVAVVAICLGMGFAYGFFQRIGAAVCMFLALAALRVHHMERWGLAALPTLIAGWTLLTTQSAYQYARWHADEIIASGCELMDRCPSSGFHNHELGHEGRPLCGEAVEPGKEKVSATKFDISGAGRQGR